ncbi:hypothetical protein C8J57DRAFT_1219292 [Mycena rebaudengoi]|nr:hypothetical protein C8J57DRAFT_1219292 [Mycena rebaudengoi]
MAGNSIQMGMEGILDLRYNWQKDLQKVVATFQPSRNLGGRCTADIEEWPRIAQAAIQGDIGGERGGAGRGLMDGSGVGSQSGSGVNFNSENRNCLRTVPEPPPESVLHTEPGSDLSGSLENCQQNRRSSEPSQIATLSLLTVPNICQRQSPFQMSFQITVVLWPIACFISEQATGRSHVNEATGLTQTPIPPHNLSPSANQVAAEMQIVFLKQLGTERNKTWQHRSYTYSGLHLREFYTLTRQIRAVRWPPSRARRYLRLDTAPWPSARSNHANINIHNAGLILVQSVESTNSWSRSLTYTHGSGFARSVGLFPSIRRFYESMLYSHINPAHRHGDTTATPSRCRPVYPPHRRVASASFPPRLPIGSLSLLLLYYKHPARCCRFLAP